ncbi:hypothetical protein LEMLEM_LOCUS23597 [Lemmus lemmus]
MSAWHKLETSERREFQVRKCFLNTNCRQVWRVFS